MGEGPNLASLASSDAPDADPFVARDAELDVLRAWWTDARNGQLPWLGLVAGVSGVGKSRLVTELATAAARDGAVVLWGTAYGTAFLAYEPWADALRGFFRTAPADLLEVAVGSDAGAVARIPWLADSVPGSPVAGIGTPTEEAVADVVAGVVDRLAAARDVLLVLDDAQWADPASVEVLRRVVGRVRGRETGYLVLAVERRPTITPGAWHEALASSAIEPRGTLLVEALDDAGCTALLRELDPELVEADLDAAVFGASGGNPFVLRELATHVGEELQRQQLLRAGDVDLVDSVPATATALWAARLEPLSRDARRGLAAASVVGLEFDIDMLQALDVGSGAGLHAAIDEAVAAGLVESLDGSGAYRFRHGLVRDYLYGETSRVRRRRLHRAIARAIEDNGDGAERDAPALAFHYLEAGRSFRYEALTNTIAAARWNVAQGASDTARDLVERALPLLRELAVEPDRDSWARRSLQLGDVLMMLGHPEGQPVLLAAADYFDEVDDVDAMVDCARFVLRQGDLVQMGGEMNEVVTFVERVLPRLDEVDPRRASRVLSRFTMVLDGRGQASRQRDLSDRAVVLGRLSGDADTLALALNCHRPGTEPDRIDDWLRSARALEALGRKHDNVEYLFHGLAWACYWELERGDLDAAERALADADEIVASAPPGQIATIRNGDLKRAMEMIILNRHIQFALSYGAQSEAEAGIARLAALAREPGQPVRFSSTLLFQVGVLADDRDGIGDSAPALEAMIDERPELVLARITTALAYSERDELDVDEVRRFYGPLIERGLEDLQPDPLLVNSLILLARVAHTLDDGDGARVIAARLAPYAGRYTGGMIGICNGPVDWALGMCAAAVGEYDEAERWYESARDLASHVKSMPFVARVELSWAQALARGGSSSTLVADHAAAAHTIATDLGMTRVAKLAAELLD